MLLTASIGIPNAAGVVLSVPVECWAEVPYRREVGSVVDGMGRPNGIADLDGGSVGRTVLLVVVQLMVNGDEEDLVVAGVGDIGQHAIRIGGVVGLCRQVHRVGVRDIGRGVQVGGRARRSVEVGGAQRGDAGIVRLGWPLPGIDINAAQFGVLILAR